MTVDDPTAPGAWGVVRIPSLRMIHIFPVHDDVYHRPDGCACEPRVGVGTDPNDPAFEPVYQHQHRPHFADYETAPRPSAEAKKLLPWGATMVISEGAGA